MKTIAIASDHAGFALKEYLKSSIEALGFAVLDLGTSSEASVDYPDFANALASVLAEKKASEGVLICGSGVGISIAANRHKHIRAALCHNPEIAKLSRAHNNANVLVLGARMIDEKTAEETVKSFFSNDFEGGRHEGRVKKLG